MSSALTYFLAGKYFSRVFSLSDEQKVLKNSLQLFRLPEEFHDWYFEKKLKGFPENQILKTSSAEVDRVTSNLSKLSDKFNRNVQLIDFGYSKLKTFSKEKVDVKSVNLEKSLHAKKIQNYVRKYNLSQDLVIDAFTYFPVLDDANPVKSLTEGYVLQGVNIEQEVVILTGEMIWSGWFSLNSLSYYLYLAKKSQCLIIIDVWGFLQQVLSDGVLFKEILVSKTINDLLEDVTVSILSLSPKDLITKEISEKVESTSIKGLFKNIKIEKNYSSDFSHKPDYVLTDTSEIMSSKIIRLGLDINRVKTLPLSILGRKNVTLEYPKEYLIQKSEGQRVEWQEDIGQKQLFEQSFAKTKLPKQVKLSVKEGEYVAKGQKIGDRTVLKGMLKEKVLSPSQGRISTKYFNLGLLKFLTKTSSETFYSPFEGEILDINKSDPKIKLSVSANSYTIFPAYKIGEDISGILVTPQEISESQEEKILLLKDSSLSGITEESIIKNNIAGVVFLKANYVFLKKLVTKLDEHKLNLTIVVLNPFSLKGVELQNEILFLHTGKIAIIDNKNLSLLLPQEELKQIFLRLKSKMGKRFSRGLAKGEEVMIFNYSTQHRYARIEKFSNNNLSINTKDGIHQTDLANISKFNITEFNAD